jgi:hypothetical protein
MLRLRIAAAMIAILTAYAVHAQDHPRDLTNELATNSKQDCSRAPGRSGSPGRPI